MTNSSNLLQKAVVGLLRKMVLTFSLCYLTPIVAMNGIKLTYSAKTTFPYGPLIHGPFGWVSAEGEGSGYGWRLTKGSRNRSPSKTLNTTPIDN